MARTEAGTSAASVEDFGAVGIVDPPLLAAAVVAVATRETADRSAAPRASARREEESRTVHLHEVEIGRSYLGNIRNLVQKTVALNSPLARVGPRRTPFDDAPTGDVGGAASPDATNPGVVDDLRSASRATRHRHPLYAGGDEEPTTRREASAVIYEVFAPCIFLTNGMTYGATATIAAIRATNAP